jgi:hypothetical protein
MAYSYDRRVAAGRVTFKPFSRIDPNGGMGSSKVLLDGVVVAYIERDVVMESVGVMQKKYTVRAYVPTLQGPIGYLPGSDLFEDKEYPDLSEVKRLLTAFLSKIPEVVPEIYTLYWAKKINSTEWKDRVLDACK